jgi:hypothetical protein
LQWPLGEPQPFAPGHMKPSSDEMQPPPQTSVTSTRNESSELAKVRYTPLAFRVPALTNHGAIASFVIFNLES